MAIERYTLKGRIKPMRDQVPTRIPRKPAEGLSAAVRRFDLARDYYRVLRVGEHYSAEQLAAAGRVFSTYQASQFLSALDSTGRVSYDEASKSWVVN